MKYSHLYLTKKQIVLIALLVCILELPLSLWERRIESTSDPSVFVTYQGLPFEAIKIKSTIDLERGPRYDPDTVQRGEWWKNMYAPGWLSALIVSQAHEYLWSGISLNTMLFIFFSTIIVKLATWIRDEIEYRRHYKS
jgi:hypothetical protein